MKLISFAVISLLAITVSAHPPPSISAANDAPQCDKNAIKQKIQDLAAAHQEQHKVVLKLEEPGKAEQEEQAIKSVMKTIEEQLKRKDLPESERPGLEKHYAGSVKDLEKAQVALTAKQKQLDEARIQRYDMWIKINILNENLKREAEQDAKDKSKTGASSSSSPHRDILQKQIDEAFQDAEDLLVVDMNIREGIGKLDDVIDRAKNPKESKLYNPWEKLTGIRQTFLKQLRSTRDQRYRTRDLQTEFGWPPQSSLFLRMYQSFWVGY